MDFTMGNYDDEIISILLRWIAIKQAGRDLGEYFVRHNYSAIAIYGWGNIGKLLFNELKNFTDIEKADMADDFAEKYEGRVNEFIYFISDSDIAVEGTFKQTWRFIEKNNNSLERHSNMHLIFK